MGVDCGRSGGVGVPAPQTLRFQRYRRWDEGDAEWGLKNALGEYAQAIRDGVDEGRMECWFIHELSSWLVTEVRGDALMVWCFEGRGARRVMELLMEVARNNKLSAVEFWTPHRALGRMLRPLGFDLVVKDDDGVMKFQAET